MGPPPPPPILQAPPLACHTHAPVMTMPHVHSHVHTHPPAAATLASSVVSHSPSPVFKSPRLLTTDDLFGLSLILAMSSVRVRDSALRKKGRDVDIIRVYFVRFPAIAAH